MTQKCCDKNELIDGDNPKKCCGYHTKNSSCSCPCHTKLEEDLVLRPCHTQSNNQETKHIHKIATDEKGRIMNDDGYYVCECGATTFPNCGWTEPNNQEITQPWREGLALILNKIDPTGFEIDDEDNRIIETFIQQELDHKELEVRSEIRKKIKLMEIYDIDDTSLTPIAMHGYNQAINEIIKLL